MQGIDKQSFFEKKRTKKTSVCRCGNAYLRNDPLHLCQHPTDKSFWFFFQKERLASLDCLYGRGEHSRVLTGLGGLTHAP